MISFIEAKKIVLENSVDLGTELVSLEEANNRILAEDILADRDFPPFDRVTKDGIAINFETYKNGNRTFLVQEIAAAGSAEKALINDNDCLEVMTGAMLPSGTDTVVMYEHLQIESNRATIQNDVRKGQNIHKQGVDALKNSLLLTKNKLITAAEIGVLATVGKYEVLVKKLPKVAIISTGNELVDIGKTPKPHQIRKSNSYTIQAALIKEGVDSKMFHLQDNEDDIETAVKNVLSNFDLLLLSGGVSKGKYDYLPQVFEKLGIKKLFHRVKQRPGKPFWFGSHKETNSTIFAFPGNPVSTYANFHVYFLPWLKKSMNVEMKSHKVILGNPFENRTELSVFKGVELSLQEGILKANLVEDNGSGDLTSLSRSDGFLLFESGTSYKEGQLLTFYPTKTIFG